MNREDIIRMAREAGAELAELPRGDAWLFTDDKCLERFAELIRKDYSTTHANLWLDRVHKFVFEEREACAKVCEEMRTYVGRNNAVTQSSAQDCATAIRARGKS